MTVGADHLTFVGRVALVLLRVMASWIDFQTTALEILLAFVFLVPVISISRIGNMGNHFVRLLLALAISALVPFAPGCRGGPLLSAAVMELVPLVNWVDCQMTAASFALG